MPTTLKIEELVNQSRQCLSRCDAWPFVLISFLFCSSATGEDFLSVGERGGISVDCGGGSFRQAETFMDFKLPWTWNFHSNWRLQPIFDVSGGWLGGENTDGFVGTLGPSVELRKGEFPLTLEGGSSPTFLSRYQFGDKSFGDNVQFTSHLGINWYFTRHLSIGYRFQHMSNAGLGNCNPGLNENVFSLAYHF